MGGGQTWGRAALSGTLTWDGLHIPQTDDLPVEDPAPSAERFEELHLLLVDDVLHHFWVFSQLWEGVTLEGGGGPEVRGPVEGLNSDAKARTVCQGSPEI